MIKCHVEASSQGPAYIHDCFVLPSTRHRGSPREYTLPTTTHSRCSRPSSLYMRQSRPDARKLVMGRDIPGPPQSRQGRPLYFDSRPRSPPRSAEVRS